MSPADAVPTEIATFGRQLADALMASGGQHLIGAYLHGSAVLGGWQGTRSDVDLLLVLHDQAPAEVVGEVSKTLMMAAPTSPGTGLECSVVTEHQARRPLPPWPFLLHIQSTGHKQVRRVAGDSIEGDRDLVMHYAVCLANGMAVLGPDPASVFGAVPRATVLACLADELDWGLAHGSAAYAVLNACRALAFAAEGKLVSKIAGGRFALDRGLGPTAVITRALDEQRGATPPCEVTEPAAEFVQLVADQLRTEQ